MVVSAANSGREGACRVFYNGALLVSSDIQEKHAVC